MYMDFYRLKKAPFALTPDPEFLFLSPSHQQAFGAILYGILERKGLVVVTGEVGLGKTTLLRSALEQVDTQQLKIVATLQANISFAALVELLARELQVSCPSDDLNEAILHLNKALTDSNSSGAAVVLIIDEAQDLPVDTLRQLRLFLNLETNTAKLLQVVLVGQPELTLKLASPQLRALRQCVAIQETLSPMTAEESVAYIEHRLAKVALDQEPIFTPGALRRIVAHAQGVPRLLNILCDNVLVAGYADQERPISAALTREVIIGLAGTSKRETSVLQRKPATLVGGLIGALVILLGGAWYWRLGHFPTWQDLSQQFAFAFDSTAAKPQHLNTQSPPPSSPTPSEKRTEQQQTMSTASESMSPDLSLSESPKSSMPALLKQASGEPIVAPQALPGAGEVGRRTLPEADSTEEKEQVGKRQPNTVEAVSPQVFPVTRIVQQGDSLSKIVANVYGRSSNERVQWVKAHNPGIQDENNIEVGQVITFPALDESLVRR